MALVAKAPAKQRPPLVVIVGPTAAGKSDLALAIADTAGCEIVSADSQQVYRGMDIGTGKASARDRQRVPHHLIDVLYPDEQMTAAVFAARADAAIADAATRTGRGVVVAGGTGLYVRALLFGLFAGPPADPAIRSRLQKDACTDEGKKALWRRLEAIDPTSAMRIHQSDVTRMIRAIEVYELTGEPMSLHQLRHNHRKLAPRYPVTIIGLSPERSTLYQRINARVDRMMADGLVDEIRVLRARGYGPALRSQSAIGYAELHSYLEKKLDLAEAIRLIKRNSRHYARRQLSWYRRDRAVRWYPQPSDVDLRKLGRYLE